jgi:sugar phosphate isomerase/epimerase
MMQWKTAFIPYWTKDAGQALDVLSRCGYEGVEWAHHLHFTSNEDLLRVAKLTRERGMAVSDIMCSQDLVSGKKEEKDQRLGFILEKIPAAREASIDIVNLFTGPVEWSSAVRMGKDMKEGDAWPYVIDAFRKIVEAAEKSDVTITVEAAFGMLVHDYYTLREFLGYFDSKNLAVNMDPSHLVLYGNDAALAVRRLGSRIKHVHVKDVIGKPGTLSEDFMFPMLGEGAVNWKDFFEALREVGYGGYLSVEFESENYLKNVMKGDWSKAARVSREQLQALVDLAGPASPKE